MCTAPPFGSWEEVRWSNKWVMRKAYGGAYIALVSKDMGYDYTLAWPTAEIAVMGAEQAVNIIYKKRKSIQKMG